MKRLSVIASKIPKIVFFFLTALSPLVHAQDQSELSSINIAAVSMFFLIVLGTLLITWWAARKIKNRTDYYAAGRDISGLQNGLAIAGDYMSAGSFLGMSGLVYFTGYDGLVFCIVSAMGMPVILFLFAERLRNLGEYTFVDVVSYRLSHTPVRVFASCCSLVVVIVYLIGQMVGAGKLIQVLFEIPYLYAITLIGILMGVYVAFGGMLATTWVQIVKAVLILLGVSYMAIVVLALFDFNFETLLTRVIEIHKAGESVLLPGGFFHDPISIISFCLLIFGVAGLPHVLMRFFTVADEREARKSMFYATGFVAYFYVLIFIIGMGAIVVLAGNSIYFDETGHLIGGVNMPAIHLAHALGGDYFLGFISAVAFATILAVVAGLTISAASSVSHDLYANVICKGEASEKTELLISRITVIAVGVIAVILGTLFQYENIAFLNSFAISIAASTSFPLLVMAIFWQGLTTRGVVIGGILSLILTLALLITSPAVWVNIFSYETALFPYAFPTLFTLPFAFFIIWLFSVTDKSSQAELERAAFKSQFIRSETGLGA
ncbi:MAG: cation/acetate symporter ActP [Gammaproteobacteria bacterium]|jgi:cation/acetate symporter|nr:cation/acetate symporter ActP [Gammaproteobacteria bacterium]